MKTIALVSGGSLPVPAVRGGAIETLLTLLIEQNEIEKKVRFVIASKYDKEAEKESKNYQYTVIKYIKNDGILEYLDRKFFWIFQRAIYKLFGSKICHGVFGTDFFYIRSYFKLNKFHPDYIVSEGGAYHRMEAFKSKYGRDRIYLHIHHEIHPDSKMNGIFGNIIAISDYVKQEYLKKSYLHTASYVVLNAVDQGKFLNKVSYEERIGLRERLGFQKDDFVVMFCGRIIKEKGCLELLQAMNRIENEKIKLLFVGDMEKSVGSESEYVEELRKEIGKLGIRICVTGYVDNDKLYQYYQSADCMVVPSLCNEAAGLVEIEGALSDCPIIATRVGGIPEYADEKDAMLIDVELPLGQDGSEKFIHDLADGIKRMYASPAEREHMAARAKENAMIKFSKEKMYLDFIHVFE